MVDAITLPAVPPIPTIDAVPVPPRSDPTSIRSGWRLRQRVLVVSLLTIAGWITWILYKGTDSSLYQSALFVFGGGGVTILGQYIFGKAWDDKNFMAFAAHAKFRPHMGPPGDCDKDDGPDDDAPPPPAK